MIYPIIDGVKTVVVTMFIDGERGFSDLALTEKQGGVLYVPEGEKVTPLMGDIIAQSRNSIFIIAQDYHPDNHISFMVNHTGVMKYRADNFKNFLAENGQPQLDDATLAVQAQQPVHFFNGYDNPPIPFPFDEIVIDEERNIIGLKEQDGRIRKVTVETSNGLAPNDNDRGRVTAVLNDYLDKTFDQLRAEGRGVSTQTLWTKHCVQGKDSSLYPDGVLPKALHDKMTGDLMSKTLYHRDPASGNQFYVVRKGAHSEVDSYGIGVENDGETMTPAWEVFRDIAREAKKAGCQKAVVNIGGLASNFCVEFSANNTADFLAGHFKMRGMDVDINFVPEISRGIPIPGGADVPFSLGGVAERLKKSRNIGEVTVDGILAMTAAPTVQPIVKSPAREFGK